MTISKLPDSTTRQLKSTVLLLTPEAVVKELIDNALDAGATSIEVQISANTVDKVQVRDNGTGISPEDYASLARPSHTSKLRSFEELEHKAGETLGFRGDALSCATDIGNTTIITRTAAEAVAKKLVFFPKPRGEVSPKAVSAPIGTTVTLTDLFNCLPVRRKEYVRKAQQSIISIKKQLQAYALARPHVKTIFKVLGGTKTSDWSYSPARPPSARDAAMQVLGLDLISNCMGRTTDDLPASSATDSCSRRLIITALMPKPEADLKAVCGHGAFISIDSRPLTPVRGTMKKLVDIFKTHLRQHMGVSGHMTKPFLHLAISTTPGSYDANITSAKDEVMFGEEQELLRLFKSMCQDAYAVQALPSPTESAHSDNLVATIVTAEEIPMANPVRNADPADRSTKSSPSLPAQPPGSSILLNEIGERSRLQHALDDTLPTIPCALASDVASPIMVDNSQCDSPIQASTAARLVGGKVDLMRTMTTSTVDESIPPLPISPWPKDLGGLCTGTVVSSAQEKSNPWTIARSTAPLSQPVAMPRTSPPPTPQTLGIEAQRPDSTPNLKMLPAIHRQAESILLTPSDNGSPSMGRTQNYVVEAMHQRNIGSGQASTSFARQSRSHHLAPLESSRGMDNRVIEDELISLSPLPSRDWPQIHGRPTPLPSADLHFFSDFSPRYVMPAASHPRESPPAHPAELEASGKADECTPWISLQASSPVVSYHQPRENTRTSYLPGNPSLASQTTLRQYLGGVSDGLGRSHRPTKTRVASVPAAAISGEYQSDAMSVPRSLVDDFVNYGLEVPSNGWEQSSDEQHDRAQKPSTPNFSSEIHVIRRNEVARTRTSHRRRTSSQVRPKTPKRLGSNGLALEKIDLSTAGIQAVISHVDIDALAIDVDAAASFDAYIVTGTLDYTLSEHSQPADPLKRHIRIWGTKWVNTMAKARPI